LNGRKTPPERSGGVFHALRLAEHHSSFHVSRSGRQKARHQGAERGRNLAMNWNQIEGNWEQFKGKAQQQWGKLTNDDLDVIKGNRKELAGKIQAHYGKSQEEAEREIDDWSARH
jgi:uncharacterized protein YjbJ (UPF0337 family)